MDEFTPEPQSPEPEPDRTERLREPMPGPATDPWVAAPEPIPAAPEPIPTASGPMPAAAEPPRRRGRRTLVAVTVAAALIAGGTAGTIAFVHRGSGVTAPRAAALSLTQSARPAPVSSAAAVIKRVLPSVVNVRVTQVAFDPFGGTQSAKAEGSGVVISKDGVILTNAHVVSGASSVKVVFSDGHASLQGTVLGVDTSHDLAVIKVNATDLTPITIGRSSSLQLGDQVYALGFPLGLGGPTVTEGIVSGLDRTIQVQGPNGVEHLVGLLQTDAAINPGNSGGALIDAAGQLVGINTAAAQAGAAEAVGFSIAIDEALPIVNQLATQTPSQRAWLGVQAASVDSAAAAAQLGLPPSTRGAVIAGVLPGGPAANAGLQRGEVIVSIDGTKVASGADLSSVLGSHHAGDRVRITVLSAQGTRTVSVTLGQRPAGL